MSPPLFVQLKFAEQKTETKPKHIHIFRPRHKHIQMFHKELFKTIGAFALKGTTYIYIDIDIDSTKKCWKSDKR